MVFLCNLCFTLIEKCQTANGPCVLTSCFHIFCKTCTPENRSNECAYCKKQCQTKIVGKDMPSAIKAFFEPPLTRVEKIQQQFRFLQEQQGIFLRLNKMVDEAEKKKENFKRKVLDMEKKVKAEEERLEKSLQAKMALYRETKAKYQKIADEEKHLNKFFEENGWPVDQNVSADSGVHSLDKST